MRSESRAVMLTDMKGFTAATIRQTRDQNAHMLALHDAADLLRSRDLVHSHLPV